MVEPRQILSGSIRSPLASAGLIRKTDGGANVEVTVVLTRKNNISRDDLHRHALMRPHERPNTDHAAFAEQYGASEDAIAAVRSLAVTYSLTVTNVDRLRRVVKLSGAVSDLERAFGTVLHDYAVGKQQFRGREGPLLLPAGTIPYVEAVLGLDNRPVAKPRLRSRNVQSGYYPQELAALYKFPPGDGAGQTIALIELGGNYGSVDLQKYFGGAGLPYMPTIRSVSVVSGVPVPYGEDTESDGEVMLDIEVAGAMAPGSTIVVYFADNSDQGFYQAVSQAVHDPATTAVSISWGSPEKGWSGQTMDAWNSLGQNATLLNVPIFVAAGDHGCVDEQANEQGYDGQRHADFPGTCPFGIASCGGTSVQGQNGVIVAETVWNDGDGWATGGGISSHFQMPDWQRGIVADGNTPLVMRGVPDVAGHAESSIKVRVNGEPSVSGGTSAVAPQWAALTALLSQQLGKKAGCFIPLLYANASTSATNDIVSGNNSVAGVAGFSAKPGWDACTGLGSPNGEKLLALLRGLTIPASAPEPATVATNTPASQSTDAASITAGSQPRVDSSFDPKAAVFYGQFVQAAYTMYGADPNNLTPSQSADFPAGYRLAAWIKMQDFIIESTGPVFYGFIAQSTSNINELVVAIRGTSNGVEWWDDANAALKTPFKVAGCGSVGNGFARIYDTLEVVERPASAPAAAAAAQSLKPAGGFSRQIAELASRHAVAAARSTSVPSTSVIIAGHSLGAALATLYAMENAKTDQIKNPLICTFASPLVGDSTFAAAFNQLNLTSWRVVNAPDLVPKLPPEFLGFTHVNALQLFNSSGKVQSSVSCWHALATYLSLVDPLLQPSANCQLAATKPDFVPSRPQATRTQMRQLVAGAGIPDSDNADIVAALNSVADACDVDPAAIAGIIHTESVWDTKCVTGSYIGLTQVGPELLKLLNLTRDQFLALSAADQIQAYAKWLGYYQYSQQTSKYGMNVAAQPLARQTAVLQAMQFAPNGSKWKKAFGQGNYSVPSTSSKQALFLGDTSIHDMEAYYTAFFVQHPPSYAGNLGPVAAAAQIRSQVAIEQAAPAPAAGVVPADKENIPALLKLSSDPAQLVAAQNVAARRLLDYDDEIYPSDGCAITLSVLLQDAGIGVADIFLAFDLGNILRNNRGWRVVGTGEQQAGDVGSTCGSTPHRGTDHIYLVLKTINSDEMVIADNQADAPHFRWASGKGGKSPTMFFLRAT
jgi:kumamolisin